MAIKATRRIDPRDRKAALGGLRRESPNDVAGDPRFAWRVAVAANARVFSPFAHSRSNGASRSRPSRRPIWAAQCVHKALRLKGHHQVDDEEKDNTKSQQKEEPKPCRAKQTQTTIATPRSFPFLYLPTYFDQSSSSHNTTTPYVFCTHPPTTNYPIKFSFCASFVSHDTGAEYTSPGLAVSIRAASRVPWSMARFASSSAASSEPPIRKTGTPALVSGSCSSRRGSWPAQVTTVSTGRTLVSSPRL